MEYPNYTIISYCCDKYPGIGGVARYDSQLNIIFPSRVFFTGPKQKNLMLEFLSKCSNPIVITDNHLSCDIPNQYPILLVHHGCAKTTSERTPNWDKYWRDLCCNGQNIMLNYRDPLKTWIISISKACSDDFTKYYSDSYTKFKRLDILHPSEFNDSIYKNTFNSNPKVLGNWAHEKKGKDLIPDLIKNSKQFEFIQLNISPGKNESLENFNKRKQQIYLDSDIFLQISVSEGNSYATLDALLCGLVVVASNVGLFYADVPDDCFVKIPWEKNNDIDFVLEKINYAWENRDILSANGRNWYLKNCSFIDWRKKMYTVIEEFSKHNYS